MIQLVFLVPKINTSGGYHEVRNLAAFFKSNNVPASIISIYPKNANWLTSFVYLPFRLISIFLAVLRIRPSLIILTHYSNYLIAPFCKLFGIPVAFFIQDLEWIFPSRFSYIQQFFFYYCTFCFHFATYFFFGNSYLRTTFYKLSLANSSNSFIFPVGLDIPEHASLLSMSTMSNALSLNSSYDYDLVFLLRNAWFKNTSFYFDVIKHLDAFAVIPNIRILIIDMRRNPLHNFSSPNLDISVVSSLSQPDFYKVLASSRILLCLSVHEGFGLPPLEAMYTSRTVPLVLENGGSECYMSDLSELVLDRESDSSYIASRILYLLNHDHKQIQSLLGKSYESALHYVHSSTISRRKSFSQLISRLGDLT